MAAPIFGKLNVAVQSLIALLPGRELPAPAEQHGDPRQVMWEIYKTMRERGEIGLKALPPEGDFQHRIDELEAENEPLKARLAGKTCSTAIDPGEADITPPGELGACYAGIGAVPMIHRGDRRRSSRAGCSNPRTGRRRPVLRRSTITTGSKAGRITSRQMARSDRRRAVVAIMGACR